MPVSRVRRPRELPNRVAGEMPNQSLHLTAGKEKGTECFSPGTPIAIRP